MTHSQLILWTMFISSWLTVLLFMDRASLKRYMPVTLFTCFVMSNIFIIAFHYHWWSIQQSIVPWGYVINVSFAYGLFPVTVLWIYYFTSHRFWQYVGVNLVIDWIYVYLIFDRVLPWLKIAKFRLMQPWQYYLIVFGLSLLIYLYDAWQKQIMLSPHQTVSKDSRMHKPVFPIFIGFKSKSPIE
ncbi:hypothetical protein SAMN05443507_1153 [Alicyclobacillus tolerans]|uniref:Uncharacterized protein n=2 Tax=Alicyclobacillus tolerans TaxID=90970 RepID=A0A1M6SXJ6_9BACL|nr:hypothetical protein SAMN05443507_1153 [Alicyclobacillus montanus]